MEDDQDQHGIRKATSAYHFYAREQSSLVAEDLRSRGEDSSVGAVTSIVADRFKNLTADERQPYEEKAKKDKERYSREAAERDEEVLRQQEERRKQNSLVETDTRMRGSTLQNSEAMLVKESVPKRTRELSAAEVKEKQERKQKKSKDDAIIKSQHDVLKQERARQADSRLKFLLSQSDIFAHFGSGKKGAAPPAAAAAALPSSLSTASLGSNAGDKKTKRGAAKRGKAANADELDEDEAAMAAEEAEEEDGSSSSSGARKGTVLKAQPTIITGGQLREYQLEGLNWMIRLQQNGINGILADEMGLGKTLQSISILAYMSQHMGIKGPHLIMVPKSTLSNWCNEFKRFCPSIRVVRFHGTKEEREEFVLENLQAARTAESRNWDVCITTYEIVNLERNSLTKIAWRYLIIDEAHRLKNEASQFSQTVRQLQTQYRLLLTGTPLQNNLHELWALLNFLLPELFDSADQFDEWFNLDIDDVEAKQGIIEKLHKILRPFMLRRLKADVEKSLPPKMETILFIGMSSQQKQVYKQVLLRDIDMVNGAGGDTKAGRTAVLNIVMQLRKCCNHPYLFPGIEDRTLDPLGDHLYSSCGKMVLLHRLLRKLFDRDHRVLIFSQMTRMLDILEDYLIGQGYRYCRIDGNTTYDEREDRIADYNKPGSDKFIFLLSTRAGGLGINLQTADTVILYDSDWNPQADLQAQDRAHRIGQKKTVQVFRLVTDETVEVKVVERAQQKLKLDAMVVQQGRLQEKEKKMSKQDLLDTVRFGAEKIFRSKESDISDADIDLILEQGRKRTEEMNEKLQLADKGDMFDFRLDGGMKTQQFEGVDYSDKAVREQEKLGADWAGGLGFIDTGKRDRKMVTTYAENVARFPKEGENEPGRPKLPRSLKLPKMDDWQFFNRARLNKLQDMEQSLFDQLVDKGELPQSTRDLVLLSPELMEEKNRLLDEGFSNWTKAMFNLFLTNAAKVGRTEIGKIAKEMALPEEEVRRYSETFWRDGPAAFGDDWDNKVKKIEKGEKKIEEISRLSDATAQLIGMFENPWDELTFKGGAGGAGKVFNTTEDRFLLCLTHLHGHGNWDLVRSSIRRCGRFRFDFYLQSCTADQLGKRCEALMRAAERELDDRLRKKESEKDGVAGGGKAESALDRQAHTRKEIAEATRKLTQVRDQLAAAKSGHAAGSKNPQFEAAGGEAAGARKSTGGGGGGGGGGGSSSSSSSGGGGAKRPFPERDLAELARLLLDHDAWGVGKVVDHWVAGHPEVSKRQVEVTIQEVAIKEKGHWQIRPTHAHLLTGEAPPAGSAAAAAPAGGKSKAAGKGKADDAKRKREEEEAKPTKAPKKPRKAFGMYSDYILPTATKAIKDMVEYQNAAPERVREGIKACVRSWWDQLVPEERLEWDQKEAEDQKRYEREYSAYQSRPSPGATAAPVAKKPKSSSASAGAESKMAEAE